MEAEKSWQPHSASRGPRSPGGVSSSPREEDDQCPSSVGKQAKVPPAQPFVLGRSSAGWAGPLMLGRAICFTASTDVNVSHTQSRSQRHTGWHWTTRLGSLCPLALMHRSNYRSHLCNTDIGLGCPLSFYAPVPPLHLKPFIVSPRSARPGLTYLWPLLLIPQLLWTFFQFF